MKSCKYCGRPLKDNARFCLYCMKRQKSSFSIHRENLNFVPKSRFYFMIGSIVVVSMGVVILLVSLLLHTNEESSQSIPEVSSFLENSQASIASISSSQYSEASVNESLPSNKDEIMDPQEILKDMIEKEKKVMERNFPNMRWTDDDLGQYSYIADVSGYYSLKTAEEWENDYEKNGCPLDLTFQSSINLADIYFGTKGVYHWKILECKEAIDDNGEEAYYFKVRIQRQLDEIDEFHYGVQTLSMIQNVRTELSKIGTRIDIIPQYDYSDEEIVFFDVLSIPFDPTGEREDIPSNQQEVEREILKQAEEKMYPGCLYDIRLFDVFTSAQDGSVSLSVYLYVK